MTKLSAHAAVICWHFPNGQRRGAHGYKLRYGRPPLDFVSSHGQVLELKIHDDENVIMSVHAIIPRPFNDQ